MKDPRPDWRPMTTAIGIVAGIGLAFLLSRYSITVPFVESYQYAAFGILGGLIGFLYGNKHHDLASVEICGEIVTDTGLFESEKVGARDVCETIEEIDSEWDQHGLWIEIDSPGGSPVASEAIHKSIEEFDGPTVAVVSDTCASGGYLVASACDHIIARPASLVGSIGVIGSKVNAADFADELGLEYERFAAGEFKDAGVPLSETDNDEREYLQGIVDDYYDRFVQLVADGRGLAPEDVRETEARVYLGENAADIGLVDELGDARDARAYLEAELDLDDNATERAYQSPGNPAPFGGVAQHFGYGIASAVTERFDADSSVSIEVKR